MACGIIVCRISKFIPPHLIQEFVKIRVKCYLFLFSMKSLSFRILHFFELKGLPQQPCQ